MLFWSLFCEIIVKYRWPTYHKLPPYGEAFYSHTKYWMSYAFSLETEKRGITEITLQEVQIAITVWVLKSVSVCLLMIKSVEGDWGMLCHMTSLFPVQSLLESTVHFKSAPNFAPCVQKDIADKQQHNNTQTQPHSRYRACLSLFACVFVYTLIHKHRKKKDPSPWTEFTNVPGNSFSFSGSSSVNSRHRI